MSGIVMLSGDDARDEVLHWQTEGDYYEELDSRYESGYMMRLIKASLDDKTVFMFTDDRGDFSVTRYPASMEGLARSTFLALAGA